jgi:hypothetical protein
MTSKKVSSDKQHSAGPWEWWTINSWKRLQRTERGVSTNILMPCRLPGGGATIAVSDADMALIASAPDLLAALMSLCEADRDDLNNSASGVWSQAVAAIKKATEHGGLNDG